MKLSVILPTRGRPDGAQRAIESILDTASRPDHVEILLGTDADDMASDPQAIAAGCAQVSWRMAPREKTLGHLFNALVARTSGEAVLVAYDDCVYATPGWDEETRAAVLVAPQGLGVIFAHDHQCGRHHTSMPVLTRKMVDFALAHQGFVYPPWFPFWFHDTWWDEISDLSGYKHPLDWEITCPDGKGETHNLRDIPFWLDLFEGFRPRRLEFAEKLSAAMFGKSLPGLHETNRLKLHERSQVCAMKLRKLRDPAFVRRWSKRAVGEPSERYAQARSEAESLAA